MTDLSLSLIHMVSMVKEQRRVIVPPLQLVGPQGTWRLRCGYTKNTGTGQCSFSRHITSPAQSVFNGKVVNSVRALTLLLSKHGFAVSFLNVNVHMLESMQSERARAIIR
jgi:hypothetical protein